MAGVVQWLRHKVAGVRSAYRSMVANPFIPNLAWVERLCFWLTFCNCCDTSTYDAERQRARERAQAEPSYPRQTFLHLQPMLVAQAPSAPCAGL
jgi:hypothetical protein